MVQTYGQEQLEIANFTKHLERSKKAGKERSVRVAFGVGLLYLLMFSFYAYSFYWGGYLRAESIEDESKEAKYSGGSIISIMFCIMIGCMQLGGLGENSKPIIEARVAGKMLCEVVDQIPGIESNKKGSVMVEKDKVQG